MYLGRVMETRAEPRALCQPRHPYTQALLSAAPVPDPTARRSASCCRATFRARIDPPSGCVFRTRCPYAIAACAEIVPPLEHLGPDHHAACIRQDDPQVIAQGPRT